MGDNKDEMPPPDVDIGGEKVLEVVVGGLEVSVTNSDILAISSADMNFFTCTTFESNPSWFYPGLCDPSIGGFFTPDIRQLNDLSFVYSARFPFATRFYNVNLSSGTFFSCALLESGEIRCWGNGAIFEQSEQSTFGLNVGDAPAESAVALDFGVPETVKKIFAGSYQMCAIFSDDKLRCWGHGYHGQIGKEISTDFGAESPVMVGSNSYTHDCEIADGNWVHRNSYFNNSVVGPDLNYTDPIIYTSGVSPLAPVKVSSNGCTPPTSFNASLVGADTVGYSYAGNMNDHSVNLGNYTDPVYFRLSYSVGDTTGELQNNTNTIFASSQGAFTVALGKFNSDPGNRIIIEGDWGIASRIFDIFAYKYTAQLGGTFTEWVGSYWTQAGPRGSYNLRYKNYSCVTLLEGNVKCFGDNTYGQLGYNKGGVYDEGATPGLGNDSSEMDALLNVILYP